jgi:hypothetical protein
MSDEQGSDALLAEQADMDVITAARDEAETAQNAEEERVKGATPAEREPGAEFAEPDAPPLSEEHREYDPLPPEPES